MTFVTAREWGANPSKDATEDSHPIGSTLGVTLHWEGPHMGAFSHDQCAEKVRGIERFHEYGRGWGDIAYSLLVCPHGDVFEGRGAGVRPAANGSTTDNDDWYAVCYLGGERDPLTEAGKQGFIDAVRYLRREGNAGPRVNGHRDHKATTCPGDHIYRWLHASDWTDLSTKEDDMPDPKDLWNHPIENPVDGQQRPAGEWEWRTFNSVRRIERLIARGPAVDEIAAKVAAKVGSGASAKDIAAELIRQLDADE